MDSRCRTMLGHGGQSNIGPSSPMANRQQSSWWPSQSPSAAAAAAAIGAGVTTTASWVAGWRLPQPCQTVVADQPDIDIDIEIETNRIDVTPEFENSTSEIRITREKKKNRLDYGCINVPLFEEFSTKLYKRRKSHEENAVQIRQICDNIPRRLFAVRTSQSVGDDVGCRPYYCIANTVTTTTTKKSQHRVVNTKGKRSIYS
ncbi:uncharacterized protein LOC125501343 [Athalia rosae]|uniref:uncharacterized protein LOC125501343 n=1 Tax=Athalia rosae TaxID=37344 RepID=UPI0020339595|nr:uncharacterized protein LOC125501343 [Athalia rosae]